MSKKENLVYPRDLVEKLNRVNPNRTLNRVIAVTLRVKNTDLAFEDIEKFEWDPEKSRLEITL